MCKIHTHQLTSEKAILDELRKLDVEVMTESAKARLASLRLQPTLLDRIREAHKLDPESEVLSELIKSRRKTQLWEGEQGAL